MKEIIGLNGKKYDNTIAENYFCVPAVLETVIKSEGYHNIDKYSIAEYFGVTLPSHHGSLIKNINYSDKAEELGIVLKTDSINKFFNSFNIALIENYVKYSIVDRDFFVDFIRDVLLSGKHIICGFEYYSLYDKTNSTTKDYAGHVSIVFNVDLEKNTIFLLDPGPRLPGVHAVLSDDLYYSISKANDGLWVIS